MDKAEVIRLIEALAACLSSNPDQFHFTANIHIEEVTGLRVGGPGGAPTNIHATVLGGSAESVIGANIQTSIGGADFHIVQGQAAEEFRQQVHDASKIMREIARELKSAPPEPTRLKSKLAALAALAIPPFVSETVRLLLRTLGLPA